MSQKEALDILKLGNNVFLTGAAGSGKTHVLNQYINYLKNRYISVAITASTGIAATHINGVTIHSWSGIKIASDLTDDQIRELTQKPYLQKNFEAKVLIIDEISMFDARRLDLVNKVCKAFKKNDLPFGGMQVIFCGDFFQLPPVPDKNESKAIFAYHSAAWKEAQLKICYLGEQHRHKGPEGKRLFAALNDIRKNSVGEKTVTTIRSRQDTQLPSHLVVTKLYPKNEEIDSINYAELGQLPGSEEEYRMIGTGKPYLVDQLKEGCLAPELLRLKKEAVVMFVKNNFNRGYVNGTLGKVIGFDSQRNPLVRINSGKIIAVGREKWQVEDGGKIIAEIQQLPLRLAWAITIHKSQGMSLDAVEMDLSNVFEEGMGYVALTRSTSLKSIRLLGIRDLAYKINPEVLTFDVTLLEKSAAARRELKSINRSQRRKMQNAFIAKLLKK